MSGILPTLTLILVALLPFERIPTVDLLGYTVKASYIVGLLLIGAAFVRGGMFRLRLSQDEIILGVFWLIALLSVTQSPDTGRSLVIAALWLFMFKLYALVRRALAEAEVRQKAERVLFIGTAVVCLFGVYQFIGDMLGLPLNQTGLRDWYSKDVLGFTRIQSVALEPLYFSNYLLFPLFLLFARMLESKRISAGQVALGALIVTNIALGISRGAYLALLISLGLLAGYLIIQINKKRIGLSRLTPLVGSLVFGVGFAFILLGAFARPEAINNFTSHAQVEDVNSGTSVPGRLDTYRLAFNLFLEKPVLGIGIGAFGPVTKTSEEEFARYGFGTVNNEYLEILTETGVLGFLAFLGFVLAFTRRGLFAYRRQSTEKRIRLVTLGLGMFAVAIQYNFFSTLYIISIWVFLAWLAAEIDQKA